MTMTLVTDENYSSEAFDSLLALDEGYRPAQRKELPQEIGAFNLLSISSLADLPEPEWLVDGVLPVDTFTMLFGAPGSTKSFWALDAACSIAAGYPLHGSPVRKSKVIYSAGEGLRGLRWRVEAWKMAHPDADHKALEENFALLPRTVRVLDEQDAGRLLLTAKEFAPEGLGLLVVDTWARAMTGGDENSSHDSGLAIEVCETVRRESGATVLVVHHTTVDGTRERGSGSLKGAADAQMKMVKDENGTITLTCVKMKDAPEFEPRRFTLSEYGHSAVLMPHSGKTVFQNGVYSHPGAPERAISSRYGEAPF